MRNLTTADISVISKLLLKEFPEWTDYLVIDDSNGEEEPKTIQLESLKQLFITYSNITNDLNLGDNQIIAAKGSFGNIINNLEVNEEGYILDARQGKVLHELIKNLISGIIWQTQVLDIVKTPPSYEERVDGDRWIVDIGAVGDFSGFDGMVAEWIDQGAETAATISTPEKSPTWMFYEPEERWGLFVKERYELFMYYNNVWTSIGSFEELAEILEQAKQVRDDILDDPGFQAVKTDLLGPNKIGITADSISDVNIVANIKNNVVTVAGIVQDVSDVAGIKAAISNLSPIKDNITAVDGNKININKLAAIDNHVTLVSGIVQDVSNVAGIKAAISNLSPIKDNIISVDGNKANINLVAGINTAISSLSPIKDNITAVDGNKTNINAVAGNKTNIDKVANNQTNINKVSAIDTNVTTVAGIQADVVKVADIDADVVVVSENKLNIDKVAVIDSDVTTVAGINSAVSSVAEIHEDVSNVAGINAKVIVVSSIKDEVESVASIKNNIVAVDGNKANINAVHGNKTNIDKVANNEVNINKVSAIDTEVTNVSGIKDNVVAVDANKTNINAVHANKTNIDAVAGNKTNIDAVKNNESNINATAGALVNIGKVATDINNVNAVGGSINNVNAVAGNATNINGVHGNKTNIDKVAGMQANINALAPHSQAVADLGARTEELDLVAEALGDIDDLEKVNNKKSTLSENSETYYPNQKAVNLGLNRIMSEMMGYAPRNLMDVFGTLTVPATFEALRNYLIASGGCDFSILRLGDYIDLDSFTVQNWYNGAAYNSSSGAWDTPATVTKNLSYENTRVEIVGFSDYRYVGNTAYPSTPHVTFQFKNIPLTAPMHKLNASPFYSTSQGYTGSDLITIGLANWYTAIASQFGTATPYNVDRSIATVNSAEWCGAEKLFLPTAMNVFGSPGYALSAEGVRTQTQFPLYALNPNKRMKRRNGSIRQYWWLAEPSAGSSSNFTHVGHNGLLRSYHSYHSYGVAPAFLI